MGSAVRPRAWPVSRPPINLAAPRRRSAAFGPHGAILLSPSVVSVAHWDRLQNDAEAQSHVLQQFLGRAPGHAFEEPGNGHATQTSREHSKA